MKDKRFKDGREHLLTIIEPTNDDPVLICCPTCARKAFVVPESKGRVKATCIECGYNVTRSSKTRSFYWYDENPTDGYFGYLLWLRTDCCGNSLWAFNKKHLEFLESYVTAGLRERSKDRELGWSNASLAGRLPKWIKAGKNRAALIKAINDLKTKA